MATSFTSTLWTALKRVLGVQAAHELNDKLNAPTFSGDIALTDPIKTSFDATGQVEFQMADNLSHAFSARNGAAGTRALTISTNDGDESVQINYPLVTTNGIGTVAIGEIAPLEYGDGSLHKSVFTITSHAITITDAAAAGAHGSTAFYTFPEGHIRILGAHINLTAITAGAGGIDDDAVLDIGVGQAAAGVDNEELSGTEADILLLDEVTLAAGAATGNDLMGTTPIDIDGSATAGTLNLNVAVKAADVNANDTLTVTGTLTIFWIHLGDD
jgi:hypothetical protein